jgi:predicted aspartyl protease
MHTNRRLFLTGLSAMALATTAKAAEAGRVAMTMSGDGFTLPVRIKGRTLIALFDCGATQSVIDSGVAAELGLRPRSRIDVNLVYAAGRMAVTAPVRVSLGEAVFTPALAIGELRANGRPFDVLLGCDLLEAFRLDLDIATGYARLSTDHTGAITGMSAIPLTASAHGLSVDITIEGKRLRAHVDTGSNDALTIRRSWAEKNGLLRDRPVSQWISADLSGIYKIEMTSIRTVSIGDYAFTHVPTGIAEFQQDTDAAIGVELLMRCHSVWSLAASKLWLSATDEALARPFARERAGLAYLSDAQGLRVVFVAPGSPADRDGWKANDIITAIDGGPTDEAGDWKRDPARRSVQLTTADGKTRTLTLTDYY